MTEPHGLDQVNVAMGAATCRYSHSMVAGGLEEMS